MKTIYKKKKLMIHNKLTEKTFKTREGLISNCFKTKTNEQLN